ncbi:MAG TPA: LysR family transcriptional regulator [Bordetella sp.]
MDLISSLVAFLRVAEAGSFSVVASERGVTQPAISRQVRALEEHVGMRLVQRSTAGVALTEEGRNLLTPARNLVEAAEALSLAANPVQARPMGKVRLSLPAPLALHICLHIRALLDSHPNLNVDMVVRDSTSNLIEEGLDLEVRIGPIDDSSLISRRVGMTSAFLVAAPSYMADKPLPCSPQDLPNYDCVVYSRWGKGDTWRFEAPEGEVSVSVPCRLRANNASAVHHAVLAGNGIAILSHLMVADDLNAGRLISLLPECLPARLPLYIVYPSRHNLPLRTRVVIEFIADLLKNDPSMRDTPVWPVVPSPAAGAPSARPSQVAFHAGPPAG